MAAQELLEGAGQLARRARISGLVALCAVELCFLWVSIKSDVKVQRCYFYYKCYNLFIVYNAPLCISVSRTSCNYLDYIIFYSIGDTIKRHCHTRHVNVTH